MSYRFGARETDIAVCKELSSGDGGEDGAWVVLSESRRHAC